MISPIKLLLCNISKRRYMYKKTIYLDFRIRIPKKKGFMDLILLKQFMEMKRIFKRYYHLLEDEN